MVEMEQLSFDPDQVTSLTHWFDDLIAQAIRAPQPPSQEAQSYRLRNHHEDHAQASGSGVIFHEEYSGSGPFFAREPGEESAGGVSVFGIIFQQRSVDATEAETVSEAELP